MLKCIYHHQSHICFNISLMQELSSMYYILSQCDMLVGNTYVCVELCTHREFQHTHHIKRLATSIVCKYPSSYIHVSRSA